MKVRTKRGKKKGAFDKPDFLHAKKQRHLKELRKSGIKESNSRNYNCSTKASTSPDGLKDRRKRQEAKRKQYDRA